MIAMDLNPIIKDYLIDEGYRNIEIYPINAYGSSKAPFITWLEFPSVRSSEAFWMHQSTLTYTVYDNDLSRAKDIAILIQKFLNVGDDIQSIKDAISTDSQEYRICWSRFTTGGMFPPLEREGYASISRSFDVGFIDV
jgi:hypothetical protein